MQYKDVIVLGWWHSPWSRWVFFLLLLKRGNVLCIDKKTFCFCDFRGCCAPCFQRVTVQLDHPSLTLYRGERDFRSSRNLLFLSVRRS